jgi:hypothetical protein
LLVGRGVQRATGRGTRAACAPLFHTDGKRAGGEERAERARTLGG